MAKIIVVYESKYGNTKLVAETIIEGMREKSGIEIILNELNEVNLDQLAGVDAILVGSPNHMGRQTGGVKKFIDKLGKLELKGKMIAVFDTYLGGDYEKAVKKMEAQISKKLPKVELMALGLSIRVDGVKGPVAEDELPKCKEFGAKIANRI